MKDSSITGTPTALANRLIVLNVKTSSLSGCTVYYSFTSLSIETPNPLAIFAIVCILALLN